MNKQQRAEIARIVTQLSSLKEEIEGIRDDEESKLDNMPENMKDGERADQYQNNIDILQSSMDSLEESIDYLNSIE